MSTIVTQSVKFVQGIVIPSTAWAWGFADGANGQSIHTGYDYFVGAKLAQYKDGWRAGCLVMLQRLSIRPGDPIYNEWLDEGAPTADATWDGDYSDVTAAEYRSDHVGE